MPEIKHIYIFQVSCFNLKMSAYSMSKQTRTKVKSLPPADVQFGFSTLQKLMSGWPVDLSCHSSMCWMKRFYFLLATKYWNVISVHLFLWAIGTDYSVEIFILCHSWLYSICTQLFTIYGKQINFHIYGSINMFHMGSFIDFFRNW